MGSSYTGLFRKNKTKPLNKYNSQNISIYLILFQSHVNCSAEKNLSHFTILTLHRSFYIQLYRDSSCEMGIKTRFLKYYHSKLSSIVRQNIYQYKCNHHRNFDILFGEICESLLLTSSSRDQGHTLGHTCSFIVTFFSHKTVSVVYC